MRSVPRRTFTSPRPDTFQSDSVSRSVARQVMGAPLHLGGRWLSWRQQAGYVDMPSVGKAWRGSEGPRKRGGDERTGMKSDELEHNDGQSRAPSGARVSREAAPADGQGHGPPPTHQRAWASAPAVHLAAAPYVTIQLASYITGLTEKAIRRKIEDGKWLDGREYRRSPDGGIFISMKGYQAWVEKG